MRPPQSSIFSPHLQNKPLAPSFRNPAFTTPQRRVNEIPFSPAESSPALTDISEMPADTPEVEREEDTEVGSATVTPSTARSLFGKTFPRSQASGRGELQRGYRDKIRKRKRLLTDRDVGSARPRLQHDSDESDSDSSALSHRFYRRHFHLPTGRAGVQATVTQRFVWRLAFARRHGTE